MLEGDFHEDALRSRPAIDDREHLSDGAARLDGMAERQVEVHFVAVASTVADACQIAANFQLTHDALHCALRDSDAEGDAAKYELGLAHE